MKILIVLNGLMEEQHDFAKPDFSVCNYRKDL